MIELLETFLRGATTEPLKNLLDLLALSPERLLPSLLFLAALCVLNDLVRAVLMVEFSRSVLVHILLNVLTLLPAGLLGMVLLFAGYRHPERAWLNLALAMLLYVAWYIGGTLTRLARSDTEGADVGFMTVGALITFPLGLAAVLLF